MRIGLFGGTFNPIHNGHLNLARYAIKKLSLDKIIFIPAYSPPHKRIEGNASTSDRINMLKRAIKKNKRFSLSLYEIKKRGKSYSINTLKHFRKKLSKNSIIFFLIGADSLLDLKSWKDIKKLFKLAKFAVFSRPGYTFKNCPRDIITLNILGKDVSSSQIRKLIKRKKGISKFVPKKINNYIKKRKLYFY